jgi:ATP-dependent DNA helicase PIF1
MVEFNKEQNEVFDALLQRKNVFMTGYAGTGKSFVIQHLYDRVALPITLQSGRKFRYQVCAMTGCAAILLGKNAKTLHSWAGVGLAKESAEDLIKKIRRSRAVRNWMSTDLLVIDEVSMMTIELFEKLDKIGRKLRANPVPFGGIQLMLVGDFFQLPPVIRREPGAQSNEKIFIFESPLWNEVVGVIVELQEIYRQHDPVFKKCLQEIRRGYLSDTSIQLLEHCERKDWSTLRIRPTLLFPRRAEVDMINNTNIQAINKPSRCYKASIVFGPNARVSPDDADLKRAIEIMDREGPYLPELILKEGAQVMLTFNMDQANGLVNGSRGIIARFEEGGVGLPIVEFLNGIRMPIGPQTWEVEDFVDVFRSQIPLRLGYGQTVHRGQGMSLDLALISIGRDVFEYGQAYVALSRVRSLDALYIHDFEPGSIRAHPRVIQFYDEISRRREEAGTSNIAEHIPLTDDPVNNLEDMMPPSNNGDENIRRVNITRI